MWRPDTGAIQAASFTSQRDRTQVTLPLEPREMVFVVFPRQASTASRTAPVPLRTTVATIDGGWRVTFPTNLGAPPVDVTDALRAGRNEIVVTVTNQWTNRIAGDQVVPANRRVLSAAGAGCGGRAGGAAEPPESGLLGPLTVVLQADQ